jgi:hypothetical protein
MAADEAERALRITIGKQVRIVWTDAMCKSVRVESVDDEGFLYSGPDSEAYARNFELVSPNPAYYWTPFSALASIECLARLS